MNKKCAELLGKLGGGIFMLGAITEGCIRYAYPENNSTKTSSKQTWANIVGIACLVVGAGIVCAVMPHLKSENNNPAQYTNKSNTQDLNAPLNEKPQNV